MERELQEIWSKNTIETVKLERKDSETVDLNRKIKSIEEKNHLLNREYT